MLKSTVLLVVTQPIISALLDNFFWHYWFFKIRTMEDRQNNRLRFSLEDPGSDLAAITLTTLVPEHPGSAGQEEIETLVTQTDIEQENSDSPTALWQFFATIPPQKNGVVRSLQQPSPDLQPTRKYSCVQLM